MYTKSWPKVVQNFVKSWQKHGQKLAKGMAWFTKDLSNLKPPSYTKGNEKKPITIEFLFSNVYQKLNKSCPNVGQKLEKKLDKTWSIVGQRYGLVHKRLKHP